MYSEALSYTIGGSIMYKMTPLLYTTSDFTIHNRKPYYMYSEALSYTIGGSIIYNTRPHHIQQKALFYIIKRPYYI